MSQWNRLISKAWDNHQLLSLLLELTYACELNCRFCYNDRKKKGKPLSWEKYREILEDARALGCFTLTLSGGEATLSPHFFAIGKLARELRMRVTIKTHGAYMNEKIIYRIKDEIDPSMVDISIHGKDGETHDRLTQVPGSFNRLMKNLGIFKRLRIPITFRMPVTKFNQFQLEEIFDLADSLGFPIQTTLDITPRNDGDLSPLKLAPTPEGIVYHFQVLSKRAKKRNLVSADIESTDENRDKLTSRYNCGAGTGALTIDPYGDVLPCAAWRIPIGNVWHRSLKEIWIKNPALKPIRDANAASRKLVLEEGEKFHGMPFCPGRAQQETGSPVKPYSHIVFVGKIVKRVQEEPLDEAIPLRVDKPKSL